MAGSTPDEPSSVRSNAQECRFAGDPAQATAACDRSTAATDDGRHDCPVIVTVFGLRRCSQPARFG
jgi:hypothetical protein